VPPGADTVTTCWLACAEDPGLRTWVAYHRGSPADYFERRRWRTTAPGMTLYHRETRPR